MKRLSFLLEAKVTELINIPMFDDTKCFMVCTLSNDKIKNNYKGIHVSNYTSNMISVKNHRAKFGDVGIYKNEFKLVANSSNNGDDVLPNKWLGISFLIKHDNHQELLGTLTINVSEYVNERKPIDLRFLLERSKTNTIAKINLFIKHLSNDNNIYYKTSKPLDSPSSLNDEMSLNPKRSKSTLISSSSVRHRASFSVPSPTAAKSPTIDKVLNSKTSNKSIANGEYEKSLTSPSSTMFMSSIQSSKQSKQQSQSKISNIHKDLKTQKLMNEACESAINETSLLDELINKTYKFTWQINSIKYEEFTPAESVKDIIEKNGNGWKKNEEGIDMVDVVENEYRESSNLNRNNGWFQSNNGNNNNSNNNNNNNNNNSNSKMNEVNEIFTDFQDFENIGNKLKVNNDNNDSNESDSDSDSDSDDIFYSYYNNGLSNKKNSRTKRFKPLTEAEVREDLKSWNIGVN